MKSIKYTLKYFYDIDDIINDNILTYLNGMSWEQLTWELYVYQPRLIEILKINISEKYNIKPFNSNWLSRW